MPILLLLLSFKVTPKDADTRLYVLPDQTLVMSSIFFHVLSHFVYTEHRRVIKCSIGILQIDLKILYQP